MAGLTKKDRDIIDNLPSNVELDFTDYLKFLYKKKWILIYYSLNKDEREIELSFHDKTYKTNIYRRVRITARTTKNEKPFTILRNWIHKDDPENRYCEENKISYELDPSELDERLNDYIKFYYVEYRKSGDGSYSPMETIYTIQ